GLRRAGRRDPLRRLLLPYARVVRHARRRSPEPAVRGAREHSHARRSRGRRRGRGAPVMLLEATLVAPLLGSLVLAFCGHRPAGGWINVGASALTFAASLAMALEVFARGPMLTSGGLFYIDAF